MAIVSVEETSHERDASEDMTKTTYKKSWLVITDSVYDTGLTVMAAADLPSLGDSYQVLDEDGDVVENDGAALLVLKTPHQLQESQFAWVVIGDYTTDPPELVEDPLTRPYEIEWTRVKYKQAVYKDRLDVTIKNSAGEPFLPPHEKERSFWRLTLTRIEAQASFAPGALDSYCDTLNVDAFFGYSPGQCRMGNITGKKFKERGVYYYRVTYTIDINTRYWRTEKLNKGKRIRVVAGGNELREIAPVGVQQERLLNAAGDGILGANDAPIYLNFDIDSTATFADFGFSTIT